MAGVEPAETSSAFKRAALENVVADVAPNFGAPAVLKLTTAGYAAQPVAFDAVNR